MRGVALKRAWTLTRVSMALQAASKGPEPRPVAVLEMPSGPFMRTVAVGRPMVPQTTCQGGTATKVPATKFVCCVKLPALKQGLQSFRDKAMSSGQPSVHTSRSMRRSQSS